MKKPKVNGYVDSSWRLCGYGSPLEAALADGDFLSEEAAIWKPRDFDEEEEKDKLLERLQVIMEKHLTKRERKIISQRVFGMSLREIAEEMGMSSPTVKGLLESARKKIKKALVM